MSEKQERTEEPRGVFCCLQENAKLHPGGSSLTEEDIHMDGEKLMK